MSETKSVKISSDAKLVLDTIQKKEKEAITMLTNPVHWGIEDSSENMDEYIYEEKR